MKVIVVRILVLSFYYQPDLCAGSFRCTALVEELKKQSNCEIEIITTLPNRYASFSVDAQKVEKDKTKIRTTITFIVWHCHHIKAEWQIKSRHFLLTTVKQEK